MNEYAPVPLPPTLDTARVRERLTAAAVKVGVPAFETRGRRLYALGAVGVVDIGEVIVEMLPKTRDVFSAAEGTVFLGNLLRFVGGLNELGLSEAGVAGEGGDLIELIFAWASRLAAALLRDGIPRRYAVIEETSSAIRGRVELRRLVRQRPGRAFELTVRHAPLSENNPVSRIIRWLVQTIAERTNSIRTRALCKTLLHDLAPVAEIVPEPRDIEWLTLTTLEAPWAPLLALAKTFLIQDRPDPSRGGTTTAIAVLFPLHGLFEAAVRRVFREGLGGEGLRLGPVGQVLLRPVSPRAAGLISLRPDFPLARAGRMEVVGDAKWKKIFDAVDPPRPSERDAYQLAAYMAAFEVEAGFLVSPLPDGAGEDLRRADFNMLGLNRPVTLFGVRVPVLIAPNPAGQAVPIR